MRRFLFVCWVFLSSTIVAAEADKPKTVVDSLVDTTDLGKNLKTLEDYYAQVNKQLNRQIKNRQRDPFEKLVKPMPVEKSPVAKPRFIPRGQVKQEGSKSLISQISSGSDADNQLPLMQFRGFIQSDRDKAGLLEITGQGTFVVHEGDKVGLQQAGGDMVIRVVEINALNLIVEFGSLGEKVVVQ